PSTAAGFRSGSCSPASRRATAACLIRCRATTCTRDGHGPRVGMPLACCTRASPAAYSRLEVFAMTDLDPVVASTEQPSALEFPCAFPIKVMGRTQEGFAQAVVEVVCKHAPDFDPAQLEMRASKAGNWLSVTATVNATSRAQLD